MPIQYRRRDSLKSTEAERRIGEGVRQGFEPLGNDLIARLQAEAPEDTKRFKRGIKKRISGRGFATRMLLFDTAEHAETVEKGRRRGKPPGSDRLLPWVRRRGLGASAFSIKTRRQISAGTRRSFSRKAGKLRTAAQSLAVIQRSIAFLISRAIGKRGIKGLFLFRDLKKKHAGRIDAYVRRIRENVVRILNAP